MKWTNWKGWIATGLLSASLAGGCAGLERSIVRGKVEGVFTSTMTSGAEVEPLGDGLHTLRWMTYRTLWLEADGRAIVFDPLNRDAAARIREHLRERGVPIERVIYSHGHRDHASGADALGDVPVVMAHRRTAHDIEVRGYDDVTPPTEVFDEDVHTLMAGDEEIRLIRIAEAHTDALTVAHFPQRRLLYAVDLVWPNQLPPPAAPLSYSGVERALDRLLELDFETFVPGHGPVATRAEVERYRRFLRDLRAEFVAALARHEIADLHAMQTFERAPGHLGAVFFEVIDALQPRYGDWVNYDEAALATVQWAFWSILTGD